MKSFEDKQKLIKEEVEKEMESGKENLSYLKGFLENDIPKLHERLQIEIQEREDQDNMIILKTSEELSKLQDVIFGEKKSREEAEETILDLIKDTINKIQDSLSVEKKDRAKTEETLINLLEETCLKLNAVSQM